MKKMLCGILFVALLALGAGCGNENVPSLDIHEDAVTADVPADTVTPADTNVNPDVRDDVTVTDTTAEDNVVPPDTTGEDTNVTPDTAGEDVPADVPADVTADVTADVAPTVCTSNADCDGTEFCDADACGGEGVCAEKPALCLVPTIVENICACDGVIYDSECFANMAGANVGTGADCGGGGACTADGDCTSEEYCNRAACADASGTCALKPALCPIIISPVCGCDGTTYNNSCLAAANGINVDETGTACATVTTCTENAGCTSGLCYKTSCDALAEGTCQDVPTICLIIGDDVCGCNGTTYGNECLAKKALVSTDPTGVACGAEVTCAGNADCSTTEYCAKTACGDATGTCTKTPTTCKPLIGKVCGCDGAVYPNSCYAHMGRTNYEGIAECTSDKTCTKDTDCIGRYLYCRKDGCALTGQCSDIPKTCEDASLTVCGCDDVTYKNVCQAAKAGASVATMGKCGLIGL